MQRSRPSSAGSIQAKLAHLAGGQSSGKQSAAKQPGKKEPSSKQQDCDTMQNEQGPISPRGPTSGSAKPGDRAEHLRESSSESGQ